MSDWSKEHQCPDCERTLHKVNAWFDGCKFCGQLVPNVDRGRRMIAEAFTPDPEPVPPAPRAPLLRTSTAGKRKARPGPGQGVLV